MSSVAEDAQLVQLCLAGERSAFQTLIERFQNLIFGLCFRLLGHREDAEDVAQEVFLRVFRSLKSWDSTRPLKPWLAAIAVNRCKTFLEKRGRRPIPAEFVEDVATATEPTEVEDVSEEVQLALEKIREEYRTCFVLFHQQELSVQEVAEIMNVPEGTIKTWLHRARKELAEHLQRRGIGPETCHELHRI